MREPFRISVVVPSYNQSNYLSETLESLVAQEDSNLEIIVLDGGSSDNSVEIIKHYEKALAYWRSAPDNGQAAAIAEGFERATGEVMCWLNSDDLLASGALEIVRGHFQQYSEAEWIIGEVCLIDGQGQPLRYLSEPRWSAGWQIYVRNCVPQSSSFWRRSLYRRVEGVNPNYEIGMDYDLWFQFAQELQPCYVNKLLSFQRQHELTKTSTLQHVGMKTRPTIARKHFPDAAPHQLSRHFFWRAHRVLTKSIGGRYWREFTAKRTLKRVI